MKHIAQIFIVSFALAACGGGGGGSNSRDATIVGNPSTYTSAINALRDGILNDADFSTALTEAQATEMRGLSTGAFLDAYPEGFAATHDTNAEAAWRMGWTGKGVKVSIIDSFGGRTASEERPFGSEIIPISHGLSVHHIARQVAPEANYRRAPLDDPDAPLEDFLPDFLDKIQGETADGWHVINLSASVSRIQFDAVADRAARLSIDAWQAQIDQLRALDDFLPLARPSAQSGALDPNMLIVFSAGNDGEPAIEGDDACTSGLDQCDLLAAAIHEMRQENGMSSAGDRILFAGALTHGTNTIAPYSITAGRMVNDFIVAGERFFDPNNLNAEGTSLSAPRVTGAAALVRHKFPNLNGAQLKQVLVQSAEDLGDEGPDPIYGAGKLNILGALSPIRGLTE